jgi:small subunit ribosomal protein S15
MDTEKRKEIIAKFAHHPTDTGSSEVQIALLTSRVVQLTDHMRAHKHDHHSRRGLLQMVSLRRRLLNYLKKNKFDSYKNIVAELGLRK